MLNGYEYYDNACSERFFHSLKVEAFHSEKFETRAQMRATVFEYIEVKYHRQRMPSASVYKAGKNVDVWLLPLLEAYIHQAWLEITARLEWAMLSG